MRILVVTPAFFPATFFGGPIFSTLAMCRELARYRDFDVRVVTTDMAGPRIADRVDLSAPVEAGGVDIAVYRYKRSLLPDLSWGLFSAARSHIAWADAVWLTGVYNSTTPVTLLIARALRKPVIWSPRGSVQASHEWANVRRPRAKALFERVCMAIRPKGLTIHATSTAEQRACEARLPGVPVVVISNGVDTPTVLPAREWRPGGVLRLLFLSRLDRKKGIENLVEALPLVRTEVMLTIVGAGSPRYLEALRNKVSDLALSDRVEFRGHLDGAERELAFSKADLFVFPTHSENFGMVVAEALARGVPCVVSKGAPWREIEEVGAGCWVENSPQSIARAIDDASKWDLNEMGSAGRRWMSSAFSWGARAKGMRDALIAIADCTETQG